MTIFVRNLPKNWQWLNLFRYLDSLGIAVKRCFVPGKQRGFGLVELTEQQSAEQAIALLNSQTLLGQRLLAMRSTHPIVDEANGSFDDKPQPGWSPKKSYRRVPVAWKPVRVDTAWPPAGVSRYSFGA